MTMSRKTASVLAIALVACALSASAFGNEVLWKFRVPAGHPDGSPVAGDVTGNGACDIVIATTTGSVIAVDGDGFQIWRWDTGVPFSLAPTLADVAGDAGLEVLALANSGRLVCLDGRTGCPLWAFDMPGNVYWGTTCPVAADLDADGRIEILAAASAGALVCLDGSGAPTWTREEAGSWRCCPAVGDLDGDGLSEILMGSADCPLVCLSHKGEELWRLGPEGAAGSSAVVWDLDGDGTPDILTGIGSSLAAVSAQGDVLWRHGMNGDIEAGIAVADADRNGRVEVYAADMAGLLVCMSGAGELLWSGNVEERARRSPSVADVDGDGGIEILVAGYSGAIHVFDTKGTLEARVPLGGASNGTATIADLKGDGRLQVACSVTSGELVVHQWPEVAHNAGAYRVLWPEYRANAARTGSRCETPPKPPVTLAEMDCGNCYVGQNTFRVRVGNPEGRDLGVSLTVRADGKVVSAMSEESSEDVVPCQLAYTVDGRRALDLEFECAVTDGGEQVIARRHAEYVAPFIRDLAAVDDALSQLTGLMPRLPGKTGIEERVYFLRGKVPECRARTLGSVTLPSEEHRRLCEDVAGLRTECARLLSLAQCALSARETGGLLLSAANPWAPFGGMDEIVEGRLADASLAIAMFQGEVEAAALNVFNMTGRPLTLRIELEAFAEANGENRIPARDVMEVRETIDVPAGETYSAEALPALNQGRILAVPPWGARQLWLGTEPASPLTPGTWSAQVHLRALRNEPIEVSVPISIDVWDARLPEEQALSLCHWGSIDSSVFREQAGAAFDDMLAHGTNVFVAAPCPSASFDEDGELVGAIDFEAHDAYVRPRMKRGTFLFHAWPLTGPAEQFSPTWNKAAAAWLRAWVKHLADMGLGYEDFALYPVDEPGLRDGLVDVFMSYAQAAREADPNIRIYTDPVGKANLADLERMAPYVDIWCPMRRGYLKGLGEKKLAFIKSTGKPVWMYECEGSVKHQSPLAYYRGQAWLAWQHGLTGIGFWNWCRDPDPWSHDAEYSLVYPGDGIVSSKRWEAVRDGIEDYAMLLALKRAADGAVEAGHLPEAVEAARKLLTEDAAGIGAFCGGDGHGTLPGIEGAPGVRKVADERWRAIQTVRRNMAELLAVLSRTVN